MVARAPVPWRELARFNDLSLARAVATSIASMEFDVRLQGGEKPGAVPPSPYRIEVQCIHWADLAEVLEEIVDEQREFDQRLARSGAGRGAGVIIFITLTGAMDMLVLLGLLELS